MRKSKVSSTYRLPEETRNKIKELADGWNYSESEIIETAVNYLYSEPANLAKKHKKEVKEVIKVMAKYLHEEEHEDDYFDFTKKYTP